MNFPTNPPQHRLRIAAIDFLNPAPLMWNFEHEPEKTRLAHFYEIDRMPPSECAIRLAAGTADIGLIPAAAYATTPELAILPECTVASLGHIRSLILVMRANQTLESVQTIAADTSSRTTLAYTQILFRKWWNASARFVPHKPNLEAMLAECDAALLIGDPALLALENRKGREDRTGEKLVYLDLAWEWRQRTGAAWISAFWGVRPEAIRLSGRSESEVVEDFLASRNAGLLHREDLVAEWSQRIAVPAETIHTYLTENIHYLLDEACLQGLETFYRMAAETGVLPAAPQLRLLRQD